MFFLAEVADHLQRYHTTMKLQVSDTMLSLKGRWKENDNGSSGCGATGVWLNKRLYPKKPPARSVDCFAVDSASMDLARRTDIQSLLEISPKERDSIRLELRDDLQADGDIVSVYLNNCLLVNKQRLQDTPYVFYVSIPKDVSYCNLKMIAVSQGSIPPCTAILSVIALLIRIVRDKYTTVGKDFVLVAPSFSLATSAAGRHTPAAHKGQHTAPLKRGNLTRKLQPYL